MAGCRREAFVVEAEDMPVAADYEVGIGGYGEGDEIVVVGVGNDWEYIALFGKGGPLSEPHYVFEGFVVCQVASELFS